MISSNKTIQEALGRGAIHPFPARMAPGIALDALKGKKALKILDPMAGSGTVVAVSHAMGHQAVGIDVDPLSVLLARVWTSSVDAKYVQRIAETALKRALGIYKQAPLRNSYPINSDEESKKFVRYWFDDHARKQLYSLSSSISRVRDKTARDVLWCAFSRLIITKQAGASLAMDLSHSRPHKVFETAPVKPFDKFISAVNAVIGNCTSTEMSKSCSPATVSLGDARNLKIASDSIDLVLTSPPYLNAIDYMRCSKFSLVWMGYTIGQLRKIRGESVGTECASEREKWDDEVRDIISSLQLSPKLSRRNEGFLSQYIWDMGKAISEAHRVIKAGGRAIYVVGDSTMRGTFVSNSEIVGLLGVARGFSIFSKKSRDLPANRRYMPPPGKGGESGAMDSRMRREVVLDFRK